MTKTILIALIAALIASPVLAASKKHSRNTNSREAYAQTQQWQTQRHSTNPRNDVYVGGTYLGSDPDALIRFDIQREGF